MTDISSLRKDHLEKQKIAANPENSVWVSANAGAGKTRVLVDRIIRMMLPPFETSPHRILCMTFTKAAAAEMEHRLFERLGEWIALSDDELSKALLDLTGQKSDEKMLLCARRLFAKSLETPGGLKIQTIHGFCEHILRRFPVEAGIEADFNILQDYDKEQSFREIFDLLVLDAKKNNQQELLESFNKLSHLLDYEQILSFLLNSYPIYQRQLKKEKPIWDDEAFREFLKIDADTDEKIEDFCASIDWGMVDASYSALLDIGGTSNIKIAEGMELLKNHQFSPSHLIMEELTYIFLTQKGEFSKRLYTKEVSKKYPTVAEFISNLATEFYELHLAKAKYDYYQIMRNMITVMVVTYSYYENFKRENSLFDFDDLIQKTYELLHNPERSSWVLYKLDGGLSHILVDEAQDTSCEQWNIIKAISEEFFSESDFSIRTIFAVGDEKQSIYGFQGAEPIQMQMNEAHFSGKISMTEKKWASTELKGSFRSAMGIMKLVDCVFDNPVTAQGVCFNKEIRHFAVANKGPAYIYIHPPIIAESTELIRAWDRDLHDVKPILSSEAHNAKAITEKIKEILTSDIILPSTGQYVRERDILILLKKRGKLQNLLIKELKKNNLNVAGADRISLKNEIAVLDILALIDFILSPDDDLSLACVLKSPLCGFTEEELFDVAYNRSESLWRALQKQSETKPELQKHIHFFKSLFSQADFTAPYEFIEVILSHFEGRKKFRAALGDECLDALGELLGEALNFERNHTPSLQKFVHYIRHNDSDIKRESDNTEDMIRIMTVHGSKGLEAPIVFLADTTAPYQMKGLHEKILFPEGCDFPFWSKTMPKCPELEQIKSQIKSIEEEENRRLLYVALTRAKDQIYVYGSLNKNNKEKIPEASWYSYIVEGIKKMDGFETLSLSDDAPHPAYHYKDDGKAELKENLEEKSTQKYPLPDWLKNSNYMASSDEDNSELIYVAPSNNDALGKFDKNIYESLKRGQVIHKILEVIPKIPAPKRETLIKNSLRTTDYSDDEKNKILSEILSLLDHPNLQKIFSENGLSEVPIKGALSHYPDIILDGKIDRLYVDEKEIIIVDYKSDRNIESDTKLKKKYMVQMALYKQALEDSYGNKKISCYLIGTCNNCIIPLDNQELSQILKNYVFERRQGKRRLAS